MTHVEPGSLTYFNMMLYFTHSSRAGDRGLGDVECRWGWRADVGGGASQPAASCHSGTAERDPGRPPIYAQATNGFVCRRRNPHKARTARSGKKCITWREK